MSAAEIVQLIIKYGVYPVMMAVILWMLVVYTKRQNKANEEQSKRMEEQSNRMSEQEERLTRVTEASRQIAHNGNKAHSKEEEEDNREVNNYIRQQLDLIISENNANRAICVAYHNGGTYLNARNFTKCSVIAESVDLHTKPFITDYQNVQRALFIELDNALAEKGECYLNDIECIQTKAPGCYQLLKQWGTNAIYFQALVDNVSEVVLGFIAAEYNKNVPNDAQSVEHCLRKKAQRISGVLQMNHDKSSKQDSDCKTKD